MIVGSVAFTPSAQMRVTTSTMLTAIFTLSSGFVSARVNQASVRSTGELIPLTCLV